MSSFQALTLSLILHVFLLFWLSRTDTSFLNPNLDRVEVIYKTPDVKRQQMVEQSEVAEKDLVNPSPNETPPDFFSEKTVRVREQMQAQMNGPTKNRSQIPNPKTKAKPDTNTDANENSTADQSPVANWNPGFSTTDDALPENIRRGDFTALNTDAHIFYTFFARIKDQIRYRWINRVEFIIDNTNANEVKNKNQQVWQTQIEVVLDPQGRFISASVMKSSGLSGLDKAAVLAFKDGAPFPNPPQELIKSDGKIYLDYAFHVNWDPSRVVIKQNF